MDWRREDFRYAAATAAAAVLIGVLVAGNFGLVPSPFAGVDDEPLSEVVVPVLAASAPGGQAPPPGGAAQDAADVLGAVVAPAPPVDGGVAEPPAPPDTSAPASTFTTSDGAVLVGLSAPVTGTVSDVGTGVAGVEVTFDGPTGPQTRQVTPTCDGASRRTCTWEADPPGAIGNYEVSVRATDRAGNAESPGPEPITVTIVTTETAPPDDGGGGGGLGGLLDAVTGLLGL